MTHSHCFLVWNFSLLWWWRCRISAFYGACPTYGSIRVHLQALVVHYQSMFNNQNQQMLALCHRSAICDDVQLHVIEFKSGHRTRQSVTKNTSCMLTLAHGELSSRVKEDMHDQFNPLDVSFPDWRMVVRFHYLAPTIPHPPTSTKTRMCWTILIFLQSAVRSVASHNPLFRLNSFLSSSYYDTQPYSKVEHYTSKVDPNSVRYRH